MLSVGAVGGNVCARELAGGGLSPFIIVDIAGADVVGWTGGGAGFIGALTFFLSIR